MDLFRVKWGLCTTRDPVLKKVYQLYFAYAYVRTSVILVRIPYNVYVSALNVRTYVTYTATGRCVCSDHKDRQQNRSQKTK